MSAVPFKVKALYDYSSPHDDDLSFTNGQVITVVQEEDEDWYIGEYLDESGDKHEGLFPKNFVEKYEPQAPPRPVRAKKQDPPAAVEAPVPEPSVAEVEKAAPVEAPLASPPASLPSQTAPLPAEEPPAPVPTPKAAPVPEPASAKPPATESDDSPVSGKLSSFKDRMAMFNKKAAPPVTPSKPGALSGSNAFIKKPFVPPPPSRDAYVPIARQEPIQKSYRREEDPEIIERQAQDDEAAKRAGLLPSDEGQQQQAEEDAPKPTTLKERIAMLQKQQAEQAARQMELAAKKRQERPQKKRTESGDTLSSMAHAEEPADEGHSRASMESARDVPMAPETRRMSRESRAEHPPHEPFSDGGNDADQSGAGDSTEAEATEVEDNDTRLRRETAPSPLSRSATASSKDFARQHPPPVQEEAEEGDAQEEAEEEDEMDAEARRKLELRQRMAKMSGGMGMAGMFGGPMGLPGGLPPKKKPAPAAAPEAEASRGEEVASSPPRQRMPMMPMPGMPHPQHMRSPPQSPTTERPLSVSKEPEPGLPLSAAREPETVPDVEDLEQLPSEVAQPQTRAAPPLPQDRPVPPVRQPTGAPPVPGARPIPSAPSAPSEARAAPPPPPTAPMSPSAGSESDDEMSLREPIAPAPPIRRDTNLSIRGPPPPVPGSVTTSAATMSPPPTRTSFAPDAASQASPMTDKRASRGVPPVPGPPAVAMGLAETRGPAPPPPTSQPAASYGHRGQNEIEDDADDDDDVADNDDDEYEGDYDTDMAPSAAHKDALRTRDLGADDGNISEDTLGASSGIPPLSAAPPAPSIQRAAPPPPPGAASIPRDLPPPPPSAPSRPPVPPTTDDYDPYNYSSPVHGTPSRTSTGFSSQQSPAQPPRLPQGPPPPPNRAMPPPEPQSPVRETAPRMGPVPPPPTRAMPPAAPAPQSPIQVAPSRMGPVPVAPTYQSVDVGDDDDTPIPSAAPTRRSVEQSRQSVDHGYIAKDIDLSQGQGSQWWAQRNMPPPMFQGRTDVLYEIEESTASRRSGRSAVSKDVYILFPDYSQTVITARFDSKNPSDVQFEQRHEAPPNRPRQEQLEGASAKYGRAIFNATHSKANQTVGDGAPQSLVLEALRGLPTALLPVGTRAYGALIYANLGNATVQQFDEIRPGDIISFRNAKFQGKHGLSKYSDDVGKPDHAGVVVEWDGTKKKVKAYEQGRESKKVKAEGYRMGDLRSGEVKVWRVLGRSWVKWDSGE